MDLMCSSQSIRGFKELYVVKHVKRKSCLLASSMKWVVLGRRFSAANPEGPDPRWHVTIYVFHQWHSGFSLQRRTGPNGPMTKNCKKTLERIQAAESVFGRYSFPSSSPLNKPFETWKKRGRAGSSKAKNTKNLQQGVFRSFLKALKYT